MFQNSISFQNLQSSYLDGILFKCLKGKLPFILDDLFACEEKKKMSRPDLALCA
jgi:hypothetical protein